jgi:hypothetical protein
VNLGPVRDMSPTPFKDLVRRDSGLPGVQAHPLCIYIRREVDAKEVHRGCAGAVRTHIHHDVANVQQATEDLPLKDGVGVQGGHSCIAGCVMGNRGEIS